MSMHSRACIHLTALRRLPSLACDNTIFGHLAEEPANTFAQLWARQYENAMLYLWSNERTSNVDSCTLAPSRSSVPIRSLAKR